MAPQKAPPPEALSVLSVSSVLVRAHPWPRPTVPQERPRPTGVNEVKFAGPLVGWMDEVDAGRNPVISVTAPPRGPKSGVRGHNH